MPTVPTSWCYFFWPVLIFGKSTRKTGENTRKQAKNSAFLVLNFLWEKLVGANFYAFCNYGNTSQFSNKGGGVFAIYCNAIYFITSYRRDPFSLVPTKCYLTQGELNFVACNVLRGARAHCLESFHSHPQHHHQHHNLHRHRSLCCIYVVVSVRA